MDDTPNLVYRAGDKLIHTPAKSIDIDTIPTPDFDGLPLGKYFSPETILPLYTSRSCPYQCAFCTIPYASSKFRARDPQKVVDDLENLKRKYNVRMFTFVDETLIIPSLNKITREIVNRKLDVNWYGETRFDRRIDRQLARQMFESGCRKLQFGLESYNQRVLDLMKKGTKVKYILPNIKSCLSEGIAVHLFTFLGFPGETEEEAKNTCEFSKYVIRLSEEEYGNPYSTVGMGAFGLEVYSDVYYHPDRYGVTFKDDIRHLTGDEIFEIKYTVKSGLSQEETEDLVNQFHNKAILREVHERAGRIRWTTLAEKETNEEEAFLLYCLANQAKTESRPIPTEPPEHPGYLLPGTYRRSANLSPNVVVREFLRDFLRSGEQPGPVISFYDKARDLVVNLPVEEGATISATFGPYDELLSQMIPIDLLWKFISLVEEFQIKGKLSLVPCPGGLGRIDREIEGVTSHDLKKFLHAVRVFLLPHFDVSPEILTHTRYMDIHTGELGPQSEEEWSRNQSEQTLFDYLSYGLRILKSVGIPATGITSPVDFGKGNEQNYVNAVMNAVGDVSEANVSWYFLHETDGEPAKLEAQVHLKSGEPQGCVHIPGTVPDFMMHLFNKPHSAGCFQEIADLYISADGTRGVIVDQIQANSEVISILVHWPALYTNGRYTGIRLLREVLRRMKEHFSDVLIWMTPHQLSKRVVYSTKWRM